MSKAFKHILSSILMVLALVAVQAGSGLAADSQRSGTFAGRSGHVTTGGVTLTKRGTSVKLTLHGNFRLDGAPDPRIGFGKSGRYIKATQFTRLRSLSGQQTYNVPAGVDISAINEVYIWCHKFSTPLGVAKLR